LNTKYIRELISLLKIIEGSAGYSDFERGIKISSPTINNRGIRIFKNWGYKNRFSLESALLNACRFPIKKIGKENQTRLVDFLNKIFEIRQKTEKMSLEQKLLCLLENTNISTSSDWNQKTNDTLNHIIDVCEGFDFYTPSILNTAVIQTDTDAYNQQSESVALMTIHAAKGLEFPVVFVSGCEDGLLPFRSLSGDVSDMEEERRLFYVAMTRAKERLYITFTKKRKRFGKIENRALSPFVQQIEKNLLALDNRGPRKRTKPGPLQLKLF